MSKSKRASTKSILVQAIQALESRTFLSAAPQVMGYLVDYKIGNNSSAIFSENDNGAVVNNTLKWQDLNQVNYFALLPNASPAFSSLGTTPTAAASSNGALQSLSDSGFDPSVQLPAIKTAAGTDKLYVTVGGGDANAIYDMDALVNTPSAFNTFATNIYNFVKSNGLAGVDLDWEPTGQADFQVTKTQIENFGDLVATIKSTFVANGHPEFKVTAGTLGDKSEVFDSAGSDLHTQAFTLDAKAITNLDAINVEAYPGETATSANNIMTTWSSYVTSGTDVDAKSVSAPVSKLWYGIDIVPGDDTSNNPAGVIESKVDTVVNKGFGGIFVWELESDGNGEALTRIHNEIVKDTTATSNGGSVSGSVKTTGGSGIPNVTVYLDANNNSAFDSNEPHATTSATGSYTLSDIPDGVHIVRQQTPAGDTQTTPAANAGFSIDIADGGNVSGKNFVDSVAVNPTGGIVSGTVKDSHGAGIPNIKVYLDANNNVTLDASERHTLTAANGTYLFINVPPAFYIVRQQLPANIKQTTPTNNTGDHVTVTNGGNFANQNFTDSISTVATGNSVGGTVKDSHGVGIANITVYLDANNNVKLDTGELHTITGPDGTYKFTNVAPAFYIVRQQLPANIKQTTPSNNTGDHVTVTSTSKITGQNFTDTVSTVATGPTVSGTIKDTHGAGVAGITVYLDANNNSILDASEKRTTTAANGTYTITGEAPGRYIVRQKLPANIKQVTPGNNFGDHVTVTSTSKITGQNFTDNVTTIATPAKLPGKLIGSSVALNSAKSGHAASNAFDSNVSTTFEDTQANGNWLGLDLGKEFTIKQIRFAADPTNASFMEGGIFQGSDDANFNSATLLYQVPNTKTPSTSLTTIDISTTKNFRYVRYLPPAGSFGDVSEIQFFGIADT